MSIVGGSDLPSENRRYLAFAAAFEGTYLNQGDQRRTPADTLELGWRLLGPFTGAELKRLTADQLAQHHQASR
jgi:V/A-type H+-transporting ATPase subunit B